MDTYALTRFGSNPFGRAARSRSAERTERTRYRGPDRRGLVADDRAVPGRGFVAAATGSLVCVVILLTIARVATPAGVDIRVAAAQLEAAAFALALPLAALCFVRWRLVGEAAVAWLATAAVLYGAVTMGLGRVLASSGVSPEGSIAALPGAARLVAIGAIAAALVAPDVDTELRPIRMLAGAAALTVGLAAVLAQLPATFIPTPVLAGVWSLLGVASVTIGVRRRRQLLVWCGLAFTMFALSKYASLQVSDGSLSALASPMFRVVGLVWALTGATAGLARAYVHQGGRLLASITAERTAEARVQAEIDAQLERAHEARNAIATIEAATLALRYDDSDGGFGRDVLSEGLASELRRLALLVDPPRVTAPPAPFRVRDVVVALRASAGATTVLTVDVPGDLLAFGQATQTAQVLHNLLQNARRYGGRSVHIGARVEGEMIVIRVVDDGPGIPPAERTTIFERGSRGSNAVETVGDGLGLFIASRLMAEQAGDLWLEDRQEPGACFAVALPTATPLAQEVVDEGQERRQIAAAS